ncbi:hypothetical protein D3C77_22820 [compost metagenome]|uniref:hypothetical protein n=1 Tax=Pseudomonas TaxID=286 RepID=UPI000422253A|nr:MULTISPECIES: hypothetical protein [Pseudomonas]MCW2271695.1 hypothetical protein [Pseudomonas sp. JUb96]
MMLDHSGGEQSVSAGVGILRDALEAFFQALLGGHKVFLLDVAAHIHEQIQGAARKVRFCQVSVY